MFPCQMDDARDGWMRVCPLAPAARRPTPWLIYTRTCSGCRRGLSRRKLSTACNFPSCEGVRALRFRSASRLGTASVCAANGAGRPGGGLGIAGGACGAAPRLLFCFDRTVVPLAGRGFAIGGLGAEAGTGSGTRAGSGSAFEGADDAPSAPLSGTKTE